MYLSTVHVPSDYNLQNQFPILMLTWNWRVNTTEYIGTEWMLTLLMKLWYPRKRLNYNSFKACENLATKLSPSIVWLPHTKKGKSKGENKINLKKKKIVTRSKNTTLKICSERQRNCCTLHWVRLKRSKRKGRNLMRHTKHYSSKNWEKNK